MEVRARDPRGAATGASAAGAFVVAIAAAIAGCGGATARDAPGAAFDAAPEARPEDPALADADASTVTDARTDTDADPPPSTGATAADAARDAASPVDHAPCDTFGEVRDFAEGCCVCGGLSAVRMQRLWACALPATNAAACPPSRPTAGDACDPTPPTACFYCARLHDDPPPPARYPFLAACLAAGVDGGGAWSVVVDDVPVD